MKSPRFVAWRCKYLINYLIVYLEETWFYLPNTVRIHWSDGTKRFFCITTTIERKIFVVINHAGKSKDYVENSFLLCGKNLQTTTRTQVDWSERHQPWNQEWNDWFYVKRRYWNSESNSKKVSAIGKHLRKKYWKPVCYWFYVWKSWCSVLPLPPHHYILSRIEMVRNQTKYHVRHLNVYTSQPSKVVDLIQKVWKENISTENWVKFTNHVIKEEGKFRVMNHILDNEIEQSSFTELPKKGSSISNHTGNI